MQRAGQRMPLATFANTAAGHKKFIRWATKSVHPARVCLEATGIYSLQFALAVHDARNVEVMVVNPRAIKDFARACMQRAKTDAVDAGRHSGISRTHAVYRMATTGAGDPAAAGDQSAHRATPNRAHTREESLPCSTTRISTATNSSGSPKKLLDRKESI